MLSVAKRGLRLSSALLLPVAFGACSWFTDFKNQPRIEPWEPMSQNPADSLTPPRGQPMYSVPVQGTTVAGYQVSYTAKNETIDSMSRVSNPVPATAASLDIGRKNYQINCAVCHGVAGLGNGPATKYGMYGFSLVAERGKGFADGYIYGIIRNGRGNMPSYNRIEEMDRWHVVNYVRALQAGTADTSAAGYPGQNGTTIPGYTLTAPNRPSPYLKPTQQPTVGSPNINSATFKGGNERETMRLLHGAPHAEKGAAGETTKAGTPAASKEKH